MAFGAQFLLLLLKNLKIKGRNLGGTIVEALFPLMCLSLLLGLFIMFSRGADGDPSFNTVPIPSLVATARNRSSLAYAPDIPIIKELLTSAFDGRSDLLHPVKTEDELDVILNQERDSLRLFAGIFFHLTEEEYSTGNISNSISYAIRFPGQFFPNPAVLTQFTSNSNVSPNVRYLAFLSVQQNVDRAISELKIKEILGTSVTLNMTGSIGRFPLQIGEPDLDSRWQARDVIIMPVAGTWFTFCLLFTVYRLVSTIMVEKRTKVRDSMRMMGMRSEFYWLTWLLVSFLMVIPILIVCSILLKVLNIFPRSSFDVIFLTWFLYAASLITFAMLFSSFLNSVKSSGILTILALVVLSIAGSAIVTAKIDTDYKIVLSLFSPVAYNLAVNILATAENQKIPMDYSHANDVFDGLPSLNAMFGMLICDTVLYLFLAWYIDNVSSGGAKQPWNFFCRRSYWSKKVQTAYTHLLDDDGIGETINARNFEHVEGMGKPVVRIDKLRKVFDIAGQKFVAVDGFKLELYENQLVALLGHNGAGKTTLISMLTGTVDPTAGDAEMYGHSLLKDLSSLKKLIGICPQHDAIWPQLTVYEHLQLFAGFKGVPFNRLKAEAEQLIKDFELEDKRNYPAGKLSGGQKRKLSIAIALIGGSKVVFLDEPTSGMDPEGRRTVWDLLSKYKAGRVIILTTHFMDEADYLGDRIAIMRHGKLLTAGSSLFLKNRFGLGYTLTCVKKPSCNVDELASFLNANSPNIQLLSNAGAEVIFRIPRRSLEDLPQLLGGLERKKDSLGLTTYGIGQSTLEEVFLELNQESDKPLELSLNNTVFIPASEPSTKRQLSALFRKRAQFAKRDGKFLFIQFAVPIITCIIAFLVQTFVFIPNTSFATEVTFNGSIYSSYRSPWANNECSTNFFAALPQYTTESFPEFSPSELEQRVADPATNASGAVINDMCNSTPSIEHLQYVLLYNASMPHSLPYYQNLMSNAVLNKILGGIGLVNITTISQPIGAAVNMENNLISIIILFLILMGLGVLSASTTAFILQERELGVKQLQLSSGTNPIIYWLSNFIWDFILHIIIFIAIFTVAAAINWTTFGGNRLGAETVLVICYSLASVSIAYFLTFVFSGAGSGQGAALGLFLGLGFAFLVTIATTSSIVGNSSDAPHILDYIFRALSPHYLFVLSLGQLSNNVGTVTLVEKNSNLFDISLWGSSYLYLIGQFVVYGSLTLILENVTKIRLATAKFLTRARLDFVDGLEDNDVKAERQLVDSANLSDNENNLIWVKGLRKEFNARKKIRKVAVDNFSLRIPRGECFGLLGANGAGKTTTLRMVSGQLLPSKGEVSVNGHSYQELDEIRKSIGFCPQFDAIIPKLSGRAHLELFAELRGLPKDEIPNIVNAIISMINLEKYADRPCGKYSGGNKRKLSLAIALIGNPPVLYLDEPSTGMDPLARRFMWNLIMAVRSNKAIILTTHSMEECEALCTRLGIMIGGKLKCLGSPQHLKTKFGNGYRLELKTDLQHVESIPKFLEELSPDARLVDNHTTMFNYEIPMSSLTLGKVFERVESVKEELNIVDYAVSQTTLEQIFITMAQEYNHPLTDVVINQ